MISTDSMSKLSIDNLVNRLCIHDNPESAIQEYLSTHALDPGDLYFLLAARLVHIGQAGNSLPYYRKAVEFQKDNLELHHKFANALESCGEIDEAIQVRKKMVVLAQPNAILAQHTLASLLVKNNQASAAIELYEKLTLSHPNLPEIRIRVGNIYKSQGKIDQAESCYQEARLLNPDHAWALTSHLGIHKPTKPNDERIQYIERLLSNPDLSDDKKVTLNFGLGKAYETLEKYEEAITCFKAANALRQKQVPAYQHQAHLARLDTFKLAFGQPTSRISNQKETLDPIFIMGMPRSGTTLVEQIISAHSSIKGGGELTDMNFLVSQLKRRAISNNLPFNEYISTLNEDNFKSFGEIYTASVRKRLKSSMCFTDKLTHNFMHIGFILRVFPDAKIIHCKRHPADTCLSIYKNNFATYHNYAYDLKEIASHYQSYDQLMQHWISMFGNKIYEADYESLVGSPNEEIAHLLDYCGLESESGCFDFHQNSRTVSTLSMTQVREPMYDRSIGLWRKYKAHLQPLADTWKDNERLKFGIEE